MKDFQFVIQNFLKNHEKHKKYIALLLVLSIVVSFAVPFSLIMPAVSMTGELICGMEEHIHSDECYELSCGLEESDEHLHNADCYTLVCDIPEHIHSQECYSDYQEENNFDFENLSPDAINISNVMGIDENGNALVYNIANANGNNDYSKQSLTEVQLLIGDLSENPDESLSYIVNGSKSAADVITKARSKYFLGIASDFCVFLEGDFKPKDADTEGRVAIGGNIISDSGDYQIGAGDFGNNKVLDQTADYYNRKNFAHIIMGGSSLQGVAPFGTKNSGSEMIAAKGTEAEKEQNGYKRFVVPTNFELSNTSHKADSGTGNYRNNCTHWGTEGNGATLDEESQFYKSSLINFSSEFEFIKSQSEKLKNKGGKSVTISEDGNTITFDAGEGCTDETVYFELDASTIGNLDGKTFNFINIPELNGTVYSEVSSDKNVKTSFPKIANIVINVKGTNIQIGDSEYQVHTYINSEQVSNLGDDKKWSNNHPYSENLLYNFYEANTVYLNANFNGTVLAPYADVKSADVCKGHLSGSLIAKSFEGGLEFGYRPYRGTNNILGSSMGYTIPVDKFVKDTNQLLAGAKFEIIDSENNVVNSFTSGEGTNYVDIPSKVDFTGGTNYTGVESLIGTYTIKEVSAPEGYIADTGTPYTVTITEEIQSDGLIETGSGTIPTHIKATVEFSNGSSFEIELKDIYSYDGSSSKQIRRELTIDNETFYLEIDNGQVSEVSKLEGNPTGTGTIVITDDKQYAADVLTSEISSYVVTTQENGEDVPVTVTSMIDVFNNEAEGLNAYKINKIYLENANVSGGYTLTFYYNDKTSVVYEGNSINNGDLDLGNLSKENVIGISIKFNQNVSSSNFWIQENDGTNFPTIFGTNYNQSKTFEAGKTYVFPESAIKQESTTVTSTETTVVSSYVTSYYTTTVTAQYDKYATIIADPSTAQIYPTTPVDSKYYYNPDDIMMMPMPSENLKFENRCGLLFKKEDSNGNPLSGATIKLQYKSGNDYADVADTVWNWTGSSFTIDPEKLELNKVYRFHEESAPTGYETAPDIYFKKTDTNKILWGYAENNLENNLDLTYDNNRTITMTDTKITGAKVKLKKTNADGTETLDGAKFKLYSADDETTPIYPISGDGFTVNNGEIDLYETFKNGSSNANADYIQNGYLKEGLYYLYEVSAPAGYKGGQKFYFTVNKNNGVYDVVTGKPTYVLFAIESTNEGKQIWARGNASNVTKVEIKVTSPADGQSLVLYEDSALKDKTATIQNGVATFEFETPLSSVGDFKIQNVTYDNGAVVTEVKVYGDSSSGGSSGGGSSTSDFVYSLNAMAFNTDQAPTVNINSLKLYYANGASNEKQNVSVSGSTWWYPLDLSGLDTTNVVGATIITGEGTGFNFLIQKKVTGTPSIWNTPINLEANKTYNFGKTDGQNYTSSNDPNTSTGGEGGNTSNNTEEGAIDKDTTAPAGYVGLIAKNSPMGDKTSITVKKNWVDDTGYETLRPDKITVQLYRSTSQNLKPNELTDEMKSGDSVTIQDANGKWEHTWTNLETKDSEEHTYYYYVKEVTDLSDYTVSYDNNGITYGDVQIKNTLKTVDISVKKDWSVPDGVTGVTNPSSVTVKLQTSSDGTTWSDVSGKTLTLNESNSWTGKFEKLPEGKYYRVVETNIPNGWTVSYSNNNEKQFSVNGSITVTNTISVASLNIKKNWEDNVGDVRPDKINIKLYRSTTPPAGSATSNSVQPISLQEPTNNYEDYSRLLQYSLYFYDAQMCGNDVKNSSDLTWRDDCHTYDNDVAGGYHDAGDHVMFGLPQGYTASTLGWSYYENKDIYDGLGQTEHYQKIMKRFCDFFVASTTLNSNNNVTKFLYQKGNGSIDHSYWGSPENQTKAQRGELLYTNNSASDIAAEYAAALAQYAINFPNDIDKATYLNCAKALYAYSVRTNKSASVGEYTSTSYKDDQAWAAAWLYLATNEETYKNECQNLLNTFKAIADKRGYFWGDVELGAMVVYKRFIDSTYDWSIATNYLSSKCQGDSFVVLDNWGSARHNTALQMVALSASKFSDNDDINYTEWCKKQMNYILGNNSISSNENSSTCFVVGFADNSAKYPHHRGASGVSGWDSYNASDGTYPNGHELVGALVAGPKADGSYNDNFKDTVGNEVALDYNATLVGAAAALFAKYGTGTLVTDASQIGTKREVKNVYLQPNPVLTVYGKSTMYKGKTQILSYANKKGTVTWSIKDETDSSGNSVIPDCITVNSTTGLVTAVKNGTATIIATDDNNTTDTSDDIMAEFTITVTLSAITPDIPEGAELVDTITLSSSKSWQEIPNLPITDGQGNTYYYYIAEVDDRGEIISNKVSGYIPVEYDNGKSLSETGNTELSVTNKKSDVDEGSMPSTGGTGTQPYKVIGMVMAGGALIMLGIRRRKKHC